MISYRLLKHLFKIHKYGTRFILVPDKEKEGIGYLFENKEGQIYYMTKYIRNKDKEFSRDDSGIEIYIEGKKYEVYPGQRLPIELYPLFFNLFRLSIFAHKSELEEKIKKIEIKS